MRAVIQRVRSASVIVNNDVICNINNGLCVFIGIHKSDTSEDTEFIVKNLVDLKVFDDENGLKFNANVRDKTYEILCVSQFTLYAEFKGNVPNLNKAMSSKESEVIFEDILNKLRNIYRPDLIKDGKFGIYRQVVIEADGPVTINLDSNVK